MKATKEELGGARVHLRSGVVDNAADDERGVLELVPRDRRKGYKMRRVLEGALDRDSFFELAPEYGRSLVVGLARLCGQPVGVVANDPGFYAGAMTAEAAQKLRRHVELCDTFHLPIVSFVDEPGFLIGPDAERAATIRHGTAAIFAVMQTSVPWVSVIVRKAYGVAAAAHFGPRGHVIAWPSAESGALPLEGGVAVAFRREIEAAPDPEAKRRELEESSGSSRRSRGCAARVPTRCAPEKPRTECEELHSPHDTRAHRNLGAMALPEGWKRCCSPRSSDCSFWRWLSPGQRA